MDRWESILKLYTYLPILDRYKCKVCGKLLKTDKWIYKHVDDNHNNEVNELRHSTI